MNLIISVHLKKLRARRILRQSSVVNAFDSLIVEVACPEFIEGPSLKTRISVDWLILSMAIGYGVNLQAMDASDIWAFVQPGARVISPMENAVSRGNVERVKSLIDQAQDKNKSIRDALFFAGRDGRQEVVIFLLRTYPYASSSLELSRLLYTAASNGNFDLVKLALEKGANIEGTGEELSRTPLQGASASGEAQIVKYLIELGADVNAHSTIWNTPLKNALEGDHHATAQMILTTIPLSEAQKIKAAVASIKFGTPFPRDIRNLMTLKLIRQFVEEHMNYAHRLLDNVEPKVSFLSRDMMRAITNLREPQSWNAIRQEVETNFRRVLAHPLQRAGVPQLTREQQEAVNAFLKSIEGRGEAGEKE